MTVADHVCSALCCTMDEESSLVTRHKPSQYKRFDEGQPVRMCAFIDFVLLQCCNTANSGTNCEVLSVPVLNRHHVHHTYVFKRMG